MTWQLTILCYNKLVIDILVDILVNILDEQEDLGKYSYGFP